MKQLMIAERFCLIAHIAAMAFGLAGLLLVLPHPEFILTLSESGQKLFQWSMAGGGVVYILLGTAAVTIHAFRTLGLLNLVGFMIPAIFLSLSSELLGTSTGFPFGHYAYLSGLGYKIAGLVPFTIPLSWFYVGLSTYLLACSGLSERLSWQQQGNVWVIRIGAIVLGALLLTSWDFVLDPGMSQTAVPFWQWQQPGGFFGMPYQNFAGWMATGIGFMSIAAFTWRNNPRILSRSQLGLPLAIYTSNFIFAAVMSLGSLGTGISIPILLGIFLGLGPALTLWLLAPITFTSQVSGKFEGAEAERLKVEPVP
jgi:putative membrane protein